MINKNMIKITILVLTFVQMATNGLSPAMSDIAAQFPDAATSTIQMLMTLPGIFVVVLSLIAAWLTSVFPKKYLIATGSICICAMGILGTFFHGSLRILFVWSALMGIGMGLISALVVSLISDYFDGQEKTTLMGLQTGAANVGAMIMTAVGGILTAIAWQYDYLVYLLALPGLILLLIFIPGRNPAAGSPDTAASEKGSGAGSIRSLFSHKKVWLYIIFSLFVLFLFNAGPTNLSMYVTEYGIGNSVMAGWAATAFLLGGTLMGIAFGAFAKRLGQFTITLGFLLMALGFFILIFRPTVVCLFVGCLIAGMSISLVSPQCILRTSAFCTNSQELAMAAGVILAASNVGTFLTPQLTNIARVISGNEGTRNRFVLALILALIVAVVSAVILAADTRREKAGS